MADSHSKNLQTRILGSPEWPLFYARVICKQQVYDMHVIFLNIDDLYEAIR